MLPNTIYDEKKFVKSLPAKYDGFFDWEFLNPIFPGKIEITDVDGIVERHGHYILFETKAPMAMIPNGQRIMHDMMIKTGLFTIVHIWGDECEEWKIYFHNGVAKEGNGKEDLYNIVDRWVKYAERQ